MVWELVREREVVSGDPREVGLGAGLRESAVGEVEGEVLVEVNLVVMPPRAKRRFCAQDMFL
jgi:hypothetical protein